MKVLLLDNKDSFTYNIADALHKTGCDDVIIAEKPQDQDLEAADRIIFSPGPALPEDFPLMFDILRKYGNSKPILGICLGFQAIIKFFGGRLYRLDFPVHGQPRQITVTHKSKLFNGCPAKFTVGLYHSWAADSTHLPQVLRPVAFSGDGVLMAFEHENLPIFGVQFHPESYISRCGLKIFDNFLKI